MNGAPPSRDGSPRLNIPGPLSCLFQSLCFWGIFEEESWKRWLPVYLPHPSGQMGLRPTDTILGGCLCLSAVLNTELQFHCPSEGDGWSTPLASPAPPDPQSGAGAGGQGLGFALLLQYLMTPSGGPCAHRRRCIWHKHLAPHLCTSVNTSAHMDVAVCAHMGAGV